MMKTASTGYDTSKLATYRNLIKYFRKNKKLAILDYQGFVNTRKILEKYLGTVSPQTRILEIGCGQRFVRTLLFISESAKATGIDSDYIDCDFSIRGMLNIWKTNGFERSLKTMFRHFLYDRNYYRTIEQEYTKPLKWDKVDIRLMNACDLKFPESHFDFIFSNAVFEHIDDVDTACKEAARVLKSNGYGYISIDLFPSLSGGHHLEWAFPDDAPSTTIPSWDHLREKKFPPHVYLNGLRKNEYLHIFKQHFHIIEINYKFEGMDLLSNSIFNEISGYSKRDLVTRNMTLLIRPRTKTTGFSQAPGSRKQ